MIQAISVTALNKYVKELLEKDAVLTDIAIRGEISNFVNHYKTGHFYFSLKDNTCSVKAVMFRTDAQRLGFKPENGMSVILFCKVSLFERDGSFQIYVTEMLPDGVGEMQLAFEQLKERLLKEGLFDEAHKKQIPKIPQKIALVTSSTGAALQDILNVTQRRFPIVELILVPVTVQGSLAANEIAHGIELADNAKADVIIVARGGGSKEDLWVFNDERIARAAYNAKTPIISAIGHEIDYSILDFTADLRAPTPSAAAEIATPDAYAIFAKNTEVYTKIKRVMQNRMYLCYNNIDKFRSSNILMNVSNSIQNKSQFLINIYNEIRDAVNTKLGEIENKIMHNSLMADSLSPFKVISRGYAIIKKQSVAQAGVKNINIGDALSVQMKDGTLICIVDDITEETNAKL